MRWMDKLTRTTVAVHLQDGNTLRGVMVGQYRDCIVLTHATYLGGGPQDAVVQVPVDGEAVVPRESVVWLQRLPATQEAP
jgi:small nuclear ribonucleoprotein (snRNP)-like protein